MCCCTPERRTPFCQDCAWKLAEENAALKAELAEARDYIAFEGALENDANYRPAQSESSKDTKRLDWIAKKFFVCSWNGVVGEGSRQYWRIAGDHRHTTSLMTESTFSDAIDQAMQEGK